MSSPNQPQSSQDILRQLYAEDPSTAEERIEEYLLGQMASSTAEEQSSQLLELAEDFRQEKPVAVSPGHDPTLSRLAGLLLGAKADEVDLSSPQVFEKLAQSINVVFDAINDIILGINSTFAGPESETATIRLVISSQIDVDGGGESLLSYLNQIKEAFAMSLQAFQKATQTKLIELFREIDPKRIEEMSSDGKLQIGPFKKAELFETYERKFRSLESMLNSGKLQEKFLREFEKSCQEIYLRKEK